MAEIESGSKLTEFVLPIHPVFHPRLTNFFESAWLDYEQDSGCVKAEVAIPRLEDVTRLTAELRSIRADTIAQMPVKRIVASLGEVSRRWLQPDYHLRQAAEQALFLVAGFSQPMIAMLIDTTFAHLSEESMWQLLADELGDPMMLDDFRPRRSASGLTRAYGIEVLVAIFGGGDPTVAAIDINCALLAKTALIGRVSGQQPLFATLYVQSIAEVDAELAHVLAMCWWSADAVETGRKLLGSAEKIIAYGSDATIDAIIALSPEPQRVLAYGHRIGVGLIAHEMLKRDQLEDLARQAALDIVLADQLTCLSPQIIYAESEGEISPLRFSEQLAIALSELNSKLPRSRLSLEAMISFNRVKARYQFRQYEIENTTRVFGTETSAAWLVVCDPDPVLIPGPGYRSIRVCAVRHLDDAIDLIRQSRPLVSTVGLAAHKDRLFSLAERLGSSGVNRICAVGNMVKPPLTWHHHGTLHLTPLLRWVDVEV